MPRKINFRVTDEDSAMLEIIKHEICADSDAPAIRYAIKQASAVIGGRNFAPPLPDNVRFTRPPVTPELPTIEPGGTIPDPNRVLEPDINYVVDEYSSTFKPPRK